MSQTNFTPVIQSLLETDLYKFTMWQPMLHSMPSNQARYEFVCRNQPEIPLSTFADEVGKQLDHLCTLRFSEEELTYLGNLRYIKSDFVAFLRIFQLQRNLITVCASGDALQIIAEGPQVHVMAFEIYVLAIVNEIYFRAVSEKYGEELLLDEGRARLKEKIKLLRKDGNIQNQEQFGFEFFDFGVRRRFSGSWQDEVVTTLCEQVPEYFKGTSNVYLAKKHGITPIGTMAHEYLQTFQATGVQLKNFQKAALESWVQEYRGDLGVALTDVVGMDAFLADFDLFHAKLFDGLRHDSGNPVEWGEKAIAHYLMLRIEPKTKRLVFSDGLDMPTAIQLHKHFASRIRTGFGIGTNLSNDTGAKPLNIVMKLITCNGQPTAKLSDSPGKTLCQDATFLAYLRQVFNKSE